MCTNRCSVSRCQFKLWRQGRNQVNTQHALVKKLESTSDEANFADLANILFDQALLAEGGMPADPAAYVKRVNALLV